MKIIIAVAFTIIFASSLLSTTYAEATFDIAGSGAAVMNGNDPKMYQSVFRMTLDNSSTITKGTLLIYGNGSFLHAYVAPEQWHFAYDEDGSFHGQGPLQTTDGKHLDMAIDGSRVFATGTNSLWKVSAYLQGSGAEMILSYLVTGMDPHPTVNLSQNATIIIPNGNSEIANKAFYLPLSLEVMRGTTVTWQNEDNIDHVIQSQDGHGNIVSMYNSGLLHTGETFSYKFSKPGLYYYYCTIHPWRTGVVTVS